MLRVLQKTPFRSLQKERRMRNTSKIFFPLGKTKQLVRLKNLIFTFYNHKKMKGHIHVAKDMIKRRNLQESPKSRNYDL